MTGTYETSLFLSSRASLPSFFLTPRGRAYPHPPTRPLSTSSPVATLRAFGSSESRRKQSPQRFHAPPVGPPLHLAVLPGNPIVALSGNVATAGTTTARRPAPYGGQRPGDDLAAVAAALHEVPRSARSLGRFVRSDPTTTVPRGRRRRQRRRRTKRPSAPPKHSHDGTSPLPLGMDWSPPLKRWNVGI